MFEMPNEESRKEMRNTVFGNKKDGKPDYSFKNIVIYVLSIIGAGILAGLVIKYVL